MNISKYLRLEDISDDGLQVPEAPIYNVLLLSSRLKDCASLLKTLAETGVGQFSFSFENVEDIENLANQKSFDAVLVSVEAQSGKELASLKSICKILPETPVLVLADYKHKELAGRAVKSGAQDFIVADPSFPSELLRMRIASVIEKNRSENKALEFARLEKFVMRSVLENSPLLFVRFDHSFHILDCNKFFEDRLGVSRKNLRGRSMFEVLQQLELTEFQRLAQGGQVLGKRLTLLGDEQDFEDMYLDLYGWSFNRASHSNSSESEIIMVGVDITGSVKAKHLQEEFVAAIAHDLRNPVLGHEQVFSAILDKKQDAFGDLDTSLQAVRSSNLKVLQLLDTLLDIYKMDSSETLPKCTGACFNEAVMSQIDEMQMVANTSKQKINLQLEAELPKAAIDQVSCFRIASNLLFNAIKNSPLNAEIKVSTRANDEFVQLEISNSSKNKLPLESSILFERFSFADSNQEESGKRTTSGLGLYFCKKTLERFGGSISCIQEEDADSTVTFIVSVPKMKN